MLQNNTASAYTHFDFTIDGVAEGSTNGLTGWRTGTDNTVRMQLSFVRLVAGLSAASHTFNLTWRVSAGTGEIVASGTNNVVRPQFWVMEIS